MTSNTKSNNLIKWAVIAMDFVVLDAVLLGFIELTPLMEGWSRVALRMFVLLCNFAMALAQVRFSTIIHERMVNAGAILRRVVMLTVSETVLAYLLLKALDVRMPVGGRLLLIGTVLFVAMTLMRFVERRVIKYYRRTGRNSRTATFVGNDPELLVLYDKLVGDATMGYRIRGYYADAEMGEWTHTTEDGSDKMEKVRLQSSGVNHQTPATGHLPSDLKRLGTLEDLIAKLKNTQSDMLDELYVCLSRRDKELIRKISQLCDQRVVRFFYVPVSVESIGINLKREMLGDMEIFTTYENPLENPVNKLVKRVFDICFSMIFLIPTAIIFPFIYIIIKIQSPGPILFKQKRTGLDGRTFNCYKFRSMHVNADADKLQATKDDPRKYPFGNFMRKANIDELPQFLNVLKGDMSIVGPRPHMLAHTEQYSELIDKYMVRHFVKPGVTGWAQVTGFRGETKELWQMEGRVKRDIWYMEHWSIWLDIRIIWLTFKSIFIHDKNAY